MLQKIAVNSKSSGRFSSENINGRDHIVTSMLSIELDSVMNGLLYQADKVTAAISQLHLKLAPASHPTVNGKHVSAFHPLAINANHFGGFLRDTTMDGKKAITELVIDVEASGKSDDGTEIVRRIKAGERIGVSTGLTAKVINKKGSVKGKKFTGIVDDITFDHVAILLDEAPAGDNTFTLNSSGVLIHNINNEKKVNSMDELVIDLSHLSLSDKMQFSQYKAADIINAMQHKVTADEAKVIVEASGLHVNSIKPERAQEYIANAEEYAEFKLNKATALNETKDFILANSEMTADQFIGMDVNQLNAIAKSVAPKNNFVGNASGAGAEDLKFDLM